MSVSLSSNVCLSIKSVCLSVSLSVSLVCPYLDISSSRSVFLINSLGPGLSVPVQLSVLDLDISSARLETDN